MRQLRRPPPLSRPLRFPSLTGSLTASRTSLAPASGSAADAPGRCLAGVVLVRHSSEGAVRPSQLPRIPQCAFAPLSDPDPVSVHLACVPEGDVLLCARRCCPPCLKQEDPGDDGLFRDSITRLWHSLHTLRASLGGPVALAASRRNVRFRTAANLSRVGMATHWVSLTCFFFLSLRFPMYW